MKRGVLRGYAIPVQYFPFFDHTYVRSDDGQTWGCNGRSTGGKEICYGEANIQMAKWLSQEDGLAGINYMKTGVCHQIANRILLSARTLVAAARGARTSFFEWGVYGLDNNGTPCDPFINPWPELEKWQQTSSNGG